MILHGDCLEKLKSLDDNSVDAVVTDPPYGLSFMNKHWDYDVPTVELWREVLRVLKPGGHLLSFGGTRTYHRLACAIEDAGFEIRDQIQWIYGSGFPKSHNLKGEWQGFGSALKPANEPICLARKPLSEKTLAANVLKWGTGAINVDGCRIAPSSDYGRSAANAKGTVNAHNGFEGKSFKIAERNADYASALGRWPANTLFDEEAAKMLDEQSGTLKSGVLKPYIAVNTSKTSMAFDGKKTWSGEASSGGASRFFYVAKASKSERNAGLKGMPEKLGVTEAYLKLSDPRMAKKQRRIGNQNHHPTVKPIKLMAYLCRLITPPNGVVLDPFAGSGSTGVAAKKEGFKFIGIEREKEYVEIARQRLKSCSY